VPETIIAYKRKILEIARDDISGKLKKAQEDHVSIEGLDILQKEFMQINNILMAIAKERGWVAFK